MRHELLIGLFFAMQQLATPPNSNGLPGGPTPRMQLRVRLLLECVDAFISACGESRKLIPHHASWRGQSSKLSVAVEFYGSNPTPNPRDERSHSPTRHGATMMPPPRAAMPPPEAPSAEAGRRTERGTYMGGGREGESAANPSSRPPQLRRSSSAGVDVGRGMGGTSKHSREPSRDHSGSSKAGGAASLLSSKAGAAAATLAAAAAAAPPSSLVLELLVHDNLTLGLLRRRLKHELLQTGLVMPRVSYRSMELLRGGTLLEGEATTIRELQISGDAPLAVRLLRPGAEREKRDRDSSREAKHERLSALPGYLISHSNHYTGVLFEVLRAFARSAGVVEQAWAVLMRVPSWSLRLASLQRPEAVQWRREMSLLDRQPMRVLYTMQAVCAKLLPADVPEPRAASVQQMALWKQRFMGHGFITLFETFVQLAASPLPDALHAQMLSTCLAVVRACLVGYLHNAHILPAAAAAAAAAPASGGAALDPTTPGAPPLLQPSPYPAAAAAAGRASHSRQGSMDALYLRGFSIQNLKKRIVTEPDAQAPASAATPPPSAGRPRTPPRSPRTPPPDGKYAAAAAFASAAAAASPAAALSLTDAAVAARGPKLEAGAFWTLACLCLRLVTTRSHTAVPDEQRRQTALDVLKLLDAVLCAHPQLLKRFLALPDVPRALSLLLVRQPEVPVRRQASLLVQHICIDRRRCVADAIRLMQGLLPVAVEHADTSSDYWELFTSLLFAAGEGSRDATEVADSEVDADAPDGTPLIAVPSVPSVPSSSAAAAVAAAAELAAAEGEDFEAPRRELCGALLVRVLGEQAPPKAKAAAAGGGGSFRRPAKGASERVTVGLLRLLTTLVRSSGGCQQLLGPQIDALCRRCLVPDAQSQPSTGVRHACMGLLTAVCQGCLPNLRLLLPSLEEVLARDARGIGGSDEYQMWQMDTASEICKTHVGLVNQGATCYMNSLLQQLFMVPGFRDGFLAAAPPLPQRSPVVDELQRLFAHLRDGLHPARRPTPARTHARAHAHTHARAHAHARTCIFCGSVRVRTHTHTYTAPGVRRGEAGECVRRAQHGLLRHAAERRGCTPRMR